MGIYKAALLGSLAWTCAVFGRPVSYTDSFTFMTYSNYMKESLYVHYSPRISSLLELKFWKIKALIPLMGYLDTHSC